MKFELVSSFKPTGDQPQAIKKLTSGLKRGEKNQVLLGVTGSGKTFTMANVLAKIQKPTLVISHNKTLAAQLYQELKEFFPKNAVCYFVSYYDYYQPEAYVPQTDTYIAKETEINEEIDKLRLAATTNLLTRRDTLVVASVSCIYNLGSPVEYGKFVLELKTGVKIRRDDILARLADLQYERKDYGFNRCTFRVRGDTIEVFPAYEDLAIRIKMLNDQITDIQKIDPLSGNIVDRLNANVLYPAKHYMTDPRTYHDVFGQIRNDLDLRVKELRGAGKELEAQRLIQRTNYDLEMIQEVGYVNGIENYSRYFDGRKPGQPPYSLIDYFDKASNDWLLFIDESHMTIPQIRGMYNGDQSRKQTLIDYGFRLPSALDNRPLRFDEFMRKINRAVFVSATPFEWELSLAGKGNVSEQLIRPTGIIDPQVVIRPTKKQVDNLIHEVSIRVKKGQRVLITTLTKRMAEELSKFLEEKGIKVNYLHSDIETLGRQDILDDLRAGVYDVVVGINLLREGLDIPEVSLVAILDADKEGFLRSRSSLIQTMGRAARHTEATVIMYADVVTKSMKQAISEVDRRRKKQLLYNKMHKITPKNIAKPIREKLVEQKLSGSQQKISIDLLLEMGKKDVLLPDDRQFLIKKLTAEMRESARMLDFETAALLRDEIKYLQKRA